jgi:hypothetical protein
LLKHGARTLADVGQEGGFGLEAGLPGGAEHLCLVGLALHGGDAWLD